ncbi:MAG: adenylate kinase [Campylobacterota bacterium]|nr:adenylate kinase [Campylobacterota bacterium]
MSKKLILFIGAPGSGKTTDGRNIAEKHSNITHYSTGELLKAESEKETKLGKIEKAFISRGDLVPTDIVIDTIVEAIRNAPTDIILLDGFPRKEKQMKFFGDCLHNVEGIELNAVIEIQVSEDTGRQRFLENGGSNEIFDAEMKIYKSTINEIEEFYKQNDLITIIDGERDSSIVINELDDFLQQKVALL